MTDKKQTIGEKLENIGCGLIVLFVIILIIVAICMPEEQTRPIKHHVLVSMGDRQTWYESFTEITIKENGCAEFEGRRSQDYGVDRKQTICGTYIIDP